jgi:WD40 repeat protein
MGNICKMLARKRDGKTPLWKLDGRIILKWILKKNMWARGLGCSACVDEWVDSREHGSPRWSTRRRPRINNYKSCNNLPTETKHRNMARCLQLSRTWSIVSACASRRIICSNPIIATTTEVCSRQVSFLSVNHCVIYTYYFVASTSEGITLC